jgi:hypothetical protein
MDSPCAIRRVFPWRSLALLVGSVLAIGGGIVLVSTPVLGGWLFGVGAVLLICATA